MTITSMDGLVAALGASQDLKLYLPSVTNVAGGWVNLNLAGTSSFGILATPTAYGSGGTTYTQTAGTAGYPHWTAGTGTVSYLARLNATFASAGALFVYDLMWACSGFSGIVTTAQTVVSFSGMPTRNTTGLGCEIWVYCTTATGATASNITCSYTNQAGVSGHTTVSTAMITSMPAGRMFQLLLQSGDTGVQSIQSITLSASTGTAGSFGVMIVNRLATIGGLVPNVTNQFDFAGLGLPVVSDSSCLMFVNLASTTSSGIIYAAADIAQG